MQLHIDIKCLFARRIEGQGTHELRLCGSRLAHFRQKTCACRRDCARPRRECGGLSIGVNGALIEFQRARQFGQRLTAFACRAQESQPPMKIRQLRVRLTRRPCGCNLFPERHMLLLHRIEQKVIKMTLCTDGHDILLHRRACVCERRCILSKPVVGIGEIAAVAGLQSVLGDVPLHQHEIALMLGAHPPRGIPYVTNCKGSRLVVEF